VTPGDQAAQYQEPRPTAALIDRLRARDPDALRALHEAYREPLLRFCWGYLGSLEEAEDAVQEIFCKIVRVNDIPEFFRPWLYKVARNHCLNLLRDRAARKDNRAMPAASQVFEALTGNLTRLARDEMQAKVIALVQSLPEELREVLRLRYVEELSRPEIAEVLGLGESVVKTRLFEGLRRLRQVAGNLGES
jgi:RNA polymerase sigma-70 factor (ECF subfamily)